MGEGAGDPFAVGVRVGRQRELDVDSFDHEHAVLGLDLAGRLSRQSSFSGGGLTRLQRPRSRAWWHVPLRAAVRDAEVVGDLVVNAEQDRLILGRQQRASPRAPHAFDSHSGVVAALARHAAI